MKCLIKQLSVSSVFIMIINCLLFIHIPAISQKLDGKLLNDNKSRRDVGESKVMGLDRFPASFKLLQSQEKLSLNKIKQVFTPQGSIITIMSEDFEGDFPTGQWNIPSDSYTWAKRNCAAHNGNYSAWSVGGGTAGNTLPCGSNYPNSVDTWMIYGPFDLSDANWCAFSFFVSINSESSTDYFYFLASNDGSNFYGYSLSGTSSGAWLPYSLALTAVPTGSNTYENYTGQSSVWIAFYFKSNGSTNYPDGAFVDDVVLQKGLVNEPTILASFNSPGSSPRGLAFDGVDLWNADASNDRIYELTTDGTVQSSFSSPSSIPTGLAWDNTYLWNTDNNSDQIYKLTTSGSVLSSFTAPSGGASGLVWDGTGFWYCDYATPTIWKLNTSGGVLITFPAPGTASYGLAWDGQYLWLADRETLLIYKMDTAGNVEDYYLIFSTHPSGLVWDGNYLWLADRDEDKIYKLQVEQQQFENDVGIINIDVPSRVIREESIAVSVLVKNFGTASQSNFPVNYQINSEALITENFSESLQPDEEKYFIFSTPWIPSETGEYSINTFTALDGDEKTANDTKSKNITVGFANDIGSVDLKLPLKIVSGDPVPIEVIIENFGGNAQTNFQVAYQIESEEPVIETFSGTLQPYVSASKIFNTKWTPQSEGKYSLNAWTVLVADENSSNDVLPTPKQVTVDPPAVIKWKYNANPIADNSPAIGPDGTIYVCSFHFTKDNYLFALNPADGSLKWKFLVKTKGLIPVVASDGTIYIGQYFNDDLCAINPNGSKKWVVEDAAEIKPALSKDGILFTGKGGVLYAVKPDGNIKWQKSLGGNIAPPIIDQNGTIYTVAGSNSYLHSLDYNGNIKWQGNTSIENTPSLALGINGSIIISSTNGTVYSLNGSNGDLNWQLEASECPISSYAAPVVDKNGIIYVTNSLGKLIAINAQGNKIWTKNPYSTKLAPTFGADGNIYVGSLLGVKVYNSIDGSFVKSFHDPDMTGCYTVVWTQGCQITKYDNTCYSSWLGSSYSCIALTSDGMLYIGSSKNTYFYAIRTECNGLGSSPWPRFRGDNQNTGRAPSPTRIIEENDKLMPPSDFTLAQNYPNPCNPGTTIEYALSKSAYVELKVYDILGHEIWTLVADRKKPGSYSVLFDTRDLSSGVYFYILRSRDFVKTRKMLVIQ